MLDNIEEIVSNVKLSNIEESIIASSYPMKTELFNEENFKEEVRNLRYFFRGEPHSYNDTGFNGDSSDVEGQEKAENHMKRVRRLANMNEAAHDQFMSGMLISFDLTFTNKAWVELERYKFITFVSSQSTMHRISKFDLTNQYNKYVDPRIIDIMNELKDTYNEDQSIEDYLKLLYSNPSGFYLTARLTTNYRCLKNVYHQRKNHRLPEWRLFCKFIEKLPYSELITGNIK